MCMSNLDGLDELYGAHNKPGNNILTTGMQ